MNKLKDMIKKQITDVTDEKFGNNPMNSFALKILDDFLGKTEEDTLAIVTLLVLEEIKDKVLNMSMKHLNKKDNKVVYIGTVTKVEKYGITLKVNDTNEEKLVRFVPSTVSLPDNAIADTFKELIAEEIKVECIILDNEPLLQIISTRKKLNEMQEENDIPAS